EVGFTEGKRSIAGSRLAILKPIIIDGRPWPRRLESAAGYDTKAPEGLRQVRWPLRRQVREPRATRPMRIIAPRAIARKPHKQVIKQNSCPLLHRRPREPVGASALAGVAAKPDEHVGEVHQSANPHLAVTRTPS